jgi:hypothetical protein
LRRQIEPLSDAEKTGLRHAIESWQAEQVRQDQEKVHRQMERGRTRVVE